MSTGNLTVLVKIRHPDIDPAVLTETFGLTPEYCWRAGDAKLEGGEAGIRRESYWVAELPLRLPVAGPPSREQLEPERMALGREAWSVSSIQVDRPPLEGALMFAALLFQRHKEFWVERQAEGGSAELMVLLGRAMPSGFELSRELLALLSRFELSVSIDIRDAAEAAA